MAQSTRNRGANIPRMMRRAGMPAVLAAMCLLRGVRVAGLPAAGGSRVEVAVTRGSAMHTPTFTQTVYALGDDSCGGKTDHKTVTKIALSTSTSQHCVEVHNWGKVIATCKAGVNSKPGVLTFTLFDNDSCTGHTTGNRSWALGDCVQGFGVSWKYTDCRVQRHDGRDAVGRALLEAGG